MVIYKYMKKEIQKQYIFSALLIIAVLLVGNWLLGGVVVTIAILLVKDAIRLKNESVEINAKGMKIYKKDILDQELLWQDMTYIVVKGKKWLVLSDGVRKFKLTDQLQDLHKAAKEIIDYNRTNKTLFVDPTINEVFHVGVKLNSENHIIK